MKKIKIAPLGGIVDKTYAYINEDGSLDLEILEKIKADGLLNDNGLDISNTLKKMIENEELDKETINKLKEKGII